MSSTVGVPTEIKPDERRVAITPDGVRELEAHGVEVLVQAGAGLGASITDEAYRVAGAEVVATAEEVWARAGLVCKVKEPQAEERTYLRDDLVLFTYLHLAAYPKVADALCAAGTHRRRLRDGAAARRLAAPAGADERGGRSHGGAGRGPVPRGPPGRPGRAARRRPRRAAGPGRGHRRRQRRAGTRRGSPPASKRRSTCSTRTSTASASSTRSTRAASPPSLRTAAPSSAASPRPTSSSAPCSCPAGGPRW